VDPVELELGCGDTAEVATEAGADMIDPDPDPDPAIETDTDPVPEADPVADPDDDRAYC